MGINCVDTWFRSDDQFPSGTNGVLAGGEFRCHYGAHSIDTTSPYLSASDLGALKQASGSQVGFDAAWANTAAASWYAGLPTQDPWRACLRDVVIRRL